LRESWHADRIKEPKTTWKDERPRSNITFRPLKCLEVCGDRRREVEVDVAVDETVKIYLNGECVAALAVLPVQLKEMAVGFLVGEGLVQSIHDIAVVKEEKGSVICKTENEAAGGRMGIECCGEEPSDLCCLQPIGSSGSEFAMKTDTILKTVDQLNDLAKLWRRTGATHTSIICNRDGAILASCEDIGRSSSVDKTIGAALLAGTDLSQCALITSGRLSNAIVAKAARAGFPAIISRSAPMNSAVELAQKIGMTLVAFARSPNLYVYTGDERII
jgi:FdhD protein